MTASNGAPCRSVRFFPAIFDMLLINPQKNRKDQLGEFANYVPLNVPFGCGFLAGYLLHHGKSITVIDEEVTPLTVDMLDAYARGAQKPHIFGLSCLTANISRGLEIGRLIRQRHPDAVIIYGGIHPTVLPIDPLKAGVADVVVRNEGEAVLLSLYEAIKAGQDYTGIAGISYLKDGEVVNNRAQKLIDMKELPIFPYRIFEKHRGRYDFGFLTTSRGCPYDCIFCSQRAITGRTYRYMATEKVIETLEVMINRYGQKSIVFSDDNFIVHRKRMYDICGGIVANGFNEKCAFQCQARGDAIDVDALEHLKKANFTSISFGIETASNRLMEVIKKAEKVEDNVNGIRLAQKHGFMVSGTFIMGLPTETREERLSSYYLAKELNLDYTRFNNATPYPGTELYDIAVREGRLNAGQDWKNLNACAVLVGGMTRELPYVPTTCTPEELLSDVFWCNILFSARPVRLWKMLFAKSTDTAGWIALPEKWYLNAKDWAALSRLSWGFISQMAKMSYYSIKRRFGLL